MGANNNVAASVIQIKEIIRKRIINNEIGSKQKINQQLLSRELGVSRTPVTKALNMLAAEGIVDNIPNHGYFVHIYSLKEITDMFNIRQFIDMQSAACAAALASDQEISTMYGFFEPFKNNSPIDENAYINSDKKFHQYLYKFCRNELLQKIEKTYQIYDRAFLPGLLLKADESMNEHLEIINAIEKRNAIDAKYKMMLHDEHAYNKLTSAIQELEAIGIDVTKISFNKEYLK